LHPKAIDMSLDRVRRLLADCGDPQDALPPVIHVAGTNGKGSTVAYLRAIGEAAGLRVHVYTSPHLVRFNERIRVAGSIIADEPLAAVLEEIERINDGRPITFFEITSVAAFLAFARAPADLTLLEVGMGGRLDATNVVARPLVSAITRVAFDHMDYLGDTLAKIAGEKAGILKPGVPAVIQTQHATALPVIEARAHELGTKLFRRGFEWSAEPSKDGFTFRGEHEFALPHPNLAGPHQLDNAALAVAILERCAPRFTFAGSAIASGLRRAEWPARLQRLTRGKLIDALPRGCELWLDGGHNEDGATAIARWARSLRNDTKLDLVVALRTTKAAEPILAALAPVARSLIACGNPEDKIAMSPEALAAAARRAGLRDVQSAADIHNAIAMLARRDSPPARVLIFGSLYFAGAILAENS
jgi:dihydrofolate synthase/folylpolyglutamate synthase